MLHVRSARPHDLPGLYRVCLETGNAGEDATRLYRNPDLLGHVYVGPYVVGAADFATAVVDEQGVAGYLLATPDTRAFEAWREAQWWPVLRTQYPASGGTSPDDEIVRLMHATPLAPDAVVRDYPAHLHIDLLARARGQGLGRRLVEELVRRLAEQGIGGAHLDVAADNANAIAFYEHLGFTEIEPADGSILMGMRLE